MNLFEGQYAAIPQHMRDALVRWVERGSVPGDFLQAVIKNDLRDAFGRADSENEPLLKVYVQWFYNVAPAGCFGREALGSWRGIRGNAA
jgi:hypothetical protein